MERFDPQSVLIKDRHRLRRLSRQLNAGSSISVSEKTQQAVHSFQQDVLRSQQLLATRLAVTPTINYPQNLPVVERLEEIKAGINRHQVIILAGETGSGKTTQIPKLCIQLGRGRAGLIGHTQPRRIAARSVANRLAEEMACTVGEEVGYQIRFSDNTSAKTLIKVMTDGILLAETQHDRFLNRYDTIIIDEAHERSLNIDFLLGYLKNLLPRRPDLKLIVTSATIEVDKFAKHFGNAPVIEVSGRTYPVTTHYRPLVTEDEDATDLSIQDGIVQTIKEIEQDERRAGVLPGDVLVFLVGEREIRETAKLLREQQYRDTEVVPLYARLSHKEQSRVFQRHRGRRIVLATNVAETSLTVPGIRYVIDPGYARISRYSYRSKVQRLPVEAISQASAEQRKGRCGRVEKGTCYRLYSEEDYGARPAFTDPEIQRTNLASVILQMLFLRLGDIASFPFLQSPETRFINDGYKLLEELGAVTKQRKITGLGKKLSRFPVDPRLASMLVAAEKYHCIRELLVIVAALATQDPRERPHDKQQAADEKHAQWQDDQSEFLGYVILWNHYEEQRQQLSNSQLRSYCKKNFLSFMKMREWRDTHRQLRLLCQQLQMTENQQPANYEQTHHALLSGLVSQVGLRDERQEYQGPRQRKFVIFPGSRLRKKGIKWILAGELVETSRLFARTIARIEPAWIEHVAPQLLKTNYLEPHWSKKWGEVQAYAQIALYGLVIVSRRRVSYGKIDAVVSRELLIREGLIEGNIMSRLPFITRNGERREEVERLEAKTRRRDLLVSDDVLFDFYDQQLPADVVTVKSLEYWFKKLPESQKTKLELREKDLLTASASTAETHEFPDQMEWYGQRFALSYAFQPGEKSDGITINIPPAALQQLPVNRLDWLVPGLLEEKCAALIRSLPKSVRRNFVPVPDFAAAAAASLVPADEPLTEALARQLKKMSGIHIEQEQWNQAALPDHLCMNINVVDNQGRAIEKGRNYHELVDRLGSRSETLSSSDHTLFAESAGLTQWTVPPIAEQIPVQQGGTHLFLYPYLRDDKDSVTLTSGFDKVSADAQHRLGVSRLVMLALKDNLKHIRQRIPKVREIGLYYATKGRLEPLLDDLLQASVANVFVDSRPHITSQESLQRRISELKAELAPYVDSQAMVLYDILRQYHELNKLLAKKTVLALALFKGDAKSQLQGLVYPGFLTNTPRHWIQHYSRFLKALAKRLDDMPRQITREKQFLQVIDPFKQLLAARTEKHRLEGVYDPELELFRWMIEEYRVSFFAQVLGTSLSISEKKLQKQWEKVRL